MSLLVWLDCFGVVSKCRKVIPYELGGVLAFGVVKQLYQGKGS